MIVPLLRLDLGALGVAPGGMVHVLYHDCFGTTVEYRRAEGGKITLSDRTLEALVARGQELEELEELVEEVGGQCFAPTEDQTSTPVHVGGEPAWLQSPEPPAGADFIAQVDAFGLGGGGQTYFLFFDPGRDVFIQIDQMT